MSTSEREALEQARDLIKQRQFERARIILSGMPGNPQAQKWLAKLETVDPEPQTLPDARVEIDELQSEIASAQREITGLEKATRRTVGVGTALLIFFGSLFGSLIGAAADFGDAIETVDEVRAMFYPELCIVGSDTILGPELGMAQAWADAFSEEHEVRVSIDAIGSSNGLRRAADGDCAQIIAMSEPMSDSQEALLSDSGVEISCAAEVAYDIIVFITDTNNPVSVVEDRGISRILNGNDVNWATINSAYNFPITILVREGSGTTDFVLRKIARWDSEGGRVFPDEASYQICDSNDDCLNQTLSTRGSLYWVSAAWMSTQPPEYLRVLEMLQGDERGVNPLNETVNLEDYPRSLQRPLYLYVVDNGDSSDQSLELAREFLYFVRGVEGQSIVNDHYFYTYFNQPTDFSAADVPLPEGFDPIGTPGRQICK